MITNLILVRVYKLIKIVYYKISKINKNIVKLVEIIINIIVEFFDLSNLIISNKSALFTSKFFLFLSNFINVK